MFSSNTNDSEKRNSKQNILSDLQEEFSQLKATDKELSIYDKWFELQMNNALLATVSTYTKLVPEFRSLLIRQGGDMELFYSAVQDISKLTKNDRLTALRVSRRYLSRDILGKKTWSDQSS